MDFHFSHHRPRVERSRPDVAIGWTVRVTITDGETEIFDDIVVSCSAMPLDPRPRRSDVDAVIREKLFAVYDQVLHIEGRDVLIKAGEPWYPPLRRLCELFEQRRRFADVINYPLAED